MACLNIAGGCIRRFVSDKAIPVSRTSRSGDFFAAGYLANCIWCVYTVLIGYIHLVRGRRIHGPHPGEGRFVRAQRDKAVRTALREMGVSLDIVISNASSKPI